MSQEHLILTAREAVGILYPRGTTLPPGEGLRVFLSGLRSVNTRALIWRTLHQFLTIEDTQPLFDAVEDLFDELFEAPPPASPDHDR